MRAAVVEDEARARQLLRGYLEQYAREKDLSLMVDVYADGMDILDDYKPIYDVIFLDIEMPHLDGMQAARKIREMDEQVILIFVTNMRQYAVEGYSVQALDFIVKPITYPDFAFKFDKVVKLRSRMKQDEILISTSSGEKKLRVGDIFYIEVVGHQLLFHTDSGEYEAWNIPMKQIEQQLAPFGFVRCSVSYLVNLRHVQTVEGNAVVLSKATLPLSRGRRKEFMNSLTRYMGRR